MNRRIIIALLLLLIAAVLSAASFLILQDRFSALGEALENAVYANAPPEESCNRIKTAWSRCARISQMFLLHSDLTELRTTVESLPDLPEDAVVFRIACIRCLCLLGGIRDSLTPSLDNIL